MPAFANWAPPPARADLYAAALDWVNRHRGAATCPVAVAESGREPLDILPAGVRGSSDSCPLGRATGFRVDGESFSAGDGWAIELPPRVREFVMAFDQGLYPDLVRVERNHHER